MGCLMRIELITSGSTNQRSDQLSYKHHKKVVRPIGFEPMTYALEVRCSIQLSYGRILYI
jgi:hypothetical protein